jgi:cyclophilin family peptidyl-prolyl cis-trans isomerase
MIQTGDPTGTGKGGQSIWGAPFADEIRSTVKVCTVTITFSLASAHDSVSLLYEFLDIAMHAASRHARDAVCS